MQRHSCLTDINSLRDWFLSLKCPKWNLYRGYHSKMPVNASFKQQNDQMDLSESWGLLQRMIDMQSSQGGQFTVYVPAYDGGKGATMEVSINMPAAAGYGMQAPGLGGFGGFQNSGMGFVTPDELQRRINEAQEKWEMKRELEDMKAQLESASSWQDILMAKVMDIDPNAILPHLGGFFQQFLQPKAGLQLRGLSNEMQQAPVAMPPDPEQELQPFQYDTERLIPALDAMRQHFASDGEFMDGFEKLAVKFNQNPDFFKEQLLK